MIFLQVPSGTYRIGTSIEGITKCVSDWRGRLIDPCYSEINFRKWIEKEFPAHTLDCDSFEMSQTLVTNEMAKEFIIQTGAPIPESIQVNEGEDFPVWGVTLDWANAYAQWMSAKDSDYWYRLPNETEWEVAARGADFREYPYGESFNPDCANTMESGLGRTTSVLAYEKRCGPFGHCDLAGNVEEWVGSRYYVYSGGHLICDDLYQRFGMNYAILRGGSFCCGGDLSRSARRHGPFPDPKFRFTGFRLVREKKPHR